MPTLLTGPLLRDAHEQTTPDSPAPASGREPRRHHHQLHHYFGNEFRNDKVCASPVLSPCWRLRLQRAAKLLRPGA